MAAPLSADSTIRIATYHTELARDGPGLLLRDILSGKDPQVESVIRVIASVAADVLVIQSFDYDLRGHALTALRDRLQGVELSYPYLLSLRPNRGRASGLDLDGDGATGRPGDAQGYGDFSGQGGMAVLSRIPIRLDQVLDLSAGLWRDLPDARLPQSEGQPFPSQAAHDAQRLSTVGHWVVPLEISDTGRLDLLISHHTPPVFDGPEDRNGLRNRDEMRLWTLFLDNRLPGYLAPNSFVLLGDFNIDPTQGEGHRDVLRDLLGHARLQDPEPRSGPGGTSTVDWSDIGLGQRRVSYLLPSRDLPVVSSGVYWPETGPALSSVLLASRHRLVWADVRTAD